MPLVLTGRALLRKPAAHHTWTGIDDALGLAGAHLYQPAAGPGHGLELATLLDNAR